MIYIDPPYGKDDMGQFAETNYHNAITRDNLLSMLYPRLQLARELLRDDGVIFCSIDDRNQAYVKCLCDEVFGEGNFVSCCPVVTNRGGRDYGGIAITHEYILIYQKDMNIDGLNLLADENKKFTFCDENGNFNLMELRNRNIRFNSENRPNLYYPFYVNPNRKDENDLYEISLVKHKDFIEVYPIKSQGINTVWRWSKEKAKKFLNTDIKAKKKKDGSFMIVQKYRSILKRQKSVFDSVDYITEKGSNAIKDILNAKVFDYPKSTFLIIDLLKISTTAPEVEEDSESESVGDSMDCHALQGKARNDKMPQEPEIILDFFAGSGTTAHAVMELNREDGGNRQCILVSNNEKTELNPQGIAIDVTSKRLKRIMSGECYDGSRDFKWIEKNEAYGGRLEVYEIQEMADTDSSVFEKIDESCYGLRFDSTPKGVQDKIEWVCRNFELTCKRLEGEKAQGGENE